MLFFDLSANDLSQNVYRHCSGGDASVTDNDRNLATILWSIRWSGSRAWKAAHQGGTDGGSLNSEHRLMVTKPKPALTLALTPSAPAPGRTSFSF